MSAAKPSEAKNRREPSPAERRRMQELTVMMHDREKLRVGKLRELNACKKSNLKKYHICLEANKLIHDLAVTLVEAHKLMGFTGHEIFETQLAGLAQDLCIVQEAAFQCLNKSHDNKELITMLEKDKALFEQLIIIFPKNAKIYSYLSKTCLSLGTELRHQFSRSHDKKLIDPAIEANLKTISYMNQAVRLNHILSDLDKQFIVDAHIVCARLYMCAGKATEAAQQYMLAYSKAERYNIGFENEFLGEFNNFVNEFQPQNSASPTSGAGTAGLNDRAQYFFKTHGGRGSVCMMGSAALAFPVMFAGKDAGFADAALKLKQKLDAQNKKKAGAANSVAPPPAASAVDSNPNRNAAAEATPVNASARPEDVKTDDVTGDIKAPDATAARESGTVPSNAAAGGTTLAAQAANANAAAAAAVRTPSGSFAETASRHERRRG